ncbi:MAG TPA: ABC transporter permease [Candidatus Acidoferrum sp.]|nr:ABC transporter permease [Candidatus Acidoferrum sp.]
MRWLRSISNRLRYLFSKDAAERETDQELRFHLEREIAQSVANGMSTEVARRSALLEFGGVEQFKEDCREARGVNRIESLIVDFRYGLRSLRRSPGFTTVCVLTLALGIGANTAIFSMVNALLLHPYNFRDLDSLVRVWEDRGIDEGYDARYIAPADAEDLRSSNDVFEGLTTYGMQSFGLGAEGDVQPILGCRVSANFFDVLAVPPAAGRVFTTAEERPGTDQVAILSYGSWQRRFGGDPQLLGKTITLNSRVYTIVGIMPKNFDYPVPVELWVPLALTPAEKSDRAQLSLSALARLKPGISVSQVGAVLANFSHRLQQEFPKTNAGRVTTVLQLRKELYIFTLPLFLLLQAAAGFVLLLACANLANLVFARMIGRQREIALRAALGAGRARLGQLFLSETLLYSSAAGTVAIAASFASVRALRTSIPVGWTKWVPGWDGIRVDSSVLAFTILAALSVGLFLGLATVLDTSRVELNKTLKETGTGTVTRTKRRVRSTLVVVQVMFALILLVCAGLTIQGFARLANVYQGFEPASVLRIEISLPEKTYTDKVKITNFYQQVLRGTAALSGVQHVSLITNPPASNVDSETTPFTIEGQAALKASEVPSADLQTASPEFFDTLKISSVRGRVFSDADNSDGPHVVVVSRGMASRYWPKGDALGHRIKFGPPNSAEPWLTVAGVVGDVRQNWWNPATRAVIYRPFAQAPERSMTLLLRTASNPTSYVSAVRDVLRRTDPAIPLRGVNTLEEEVADSIAIVRIMGILMGIFGLVALALSSIGVYGVLSESVAQRTHEIGIRLALGADRSDMMKLILGQALKLTGIGLFIAVPCAVAISRAMASFIFGVVSLDITILAGFTVLLLFVALAAGYLPARRAMRVDPMVSLRYE